MIRRTWPKGLHNWLVDVVESAGAKISAHKKYRGIIEAKGDRHRERLANMLNG